MFSVYFKDWEVKPGYSKEFVSLWKGWLGKETNQQLDEVTEVEWSRFNTLIRSLAKDFVIEVASCEYQSLTRVGDIESVLSGYEESLNKEASEFLRIVLPKLGCVISEEWDCTYIIWHKNNGAVAALSPYITAANLEHFCE